MIVLNRRVLSISLSNSASFPAVALSETTGFWEAILSKIAGYSNIT